nr:unnamed protein product [Digitaria exilis]
MALPASPSASASAPAGERWPPLESSPEVFNQVRPLLCGFTYICDHQFHDLALSTHSAAARAQFMWSLGVPEDEAEFHDVYGLDEDALDMVPQPVLAVILCFPDPPQEFCLLLKCSLVPLQDAGYPSVPFVSCGEKETKDRVYFIKQIESLGNACGTIALIHAIGNTSSELNLVENSFLDLFFKSTASMDPYKRALFLEKNDAMAGAHSLAANAGVTELCDVVEEHYICFVAVNGTLHELDGMKDGPIRHGSSSSKSLLQT